MTAPLSVCATRLYTEAAEAADVVGRQHEVNAERFAALGARLQERPPRLVVTCARGSSDHAATYAKYLVEKYTGVPTLSAAPSMSSIYGKRMRFDDSLYLAISQSGTSPDLLAAVRAARAGGACVAALVNRTDSPLAALADEVIDLAAGEEQSVAATKSFIASVAAVLALVAAWQDDDELTAASEHLPALLAEAWELDWQPAVDALAGVRGLFVVGRGLGLGIAQEAALKFKEVCGLHAEAFSAAEVLHGPIAIAKRDFPVFLFAQQDESMPGLEALATELGERGIPLIATGLQLTAGLRLPTPPAHGAIQPILEIQSFYRMVNGLSLALGLDPDRPPYLSKITATV